MRAAPLWQLTLLAMVLGSQSSPAQLAPPPSYSPGQTAPPSYSPGQTAPPVLPSVPPSSPLPFLDPTLPKPPGPDSPIGKTGLPADLTGPALLSSWIYRPQPALSCCKPVGGDGPIGHEFNVWIGPSFLLSGGIFNGRLEPATQVGFEGRSLWFTPEGDQALTFMASVAYQYANGQGDQGVFPRQGQGVTVRGLHRSWVTLGLGRDWFSANAFPAGMPNTLLRYGFDGGGRLGSGHVDLNIPSIIGGYDREQSLIGGWYLAAHAMLEIPWGNWFWHAGVRLEYGWQYTNLVPRYRDDLQDLNLLFTTGFRF
jgi:hypothetical protein